MQNVYVAWEVPDKIKPCYYKVPFKLFDGVTVSTLDFKSKDSEVKLTSSHLKTHSQPTITYSKLTIETLEQGVKYVQS